MMTKKEFAILADMSTRELAVYIKRDKVVLVDGLIDPNHEKNVLFLEKNGISATKKTAKENNGVKVDETPNLKDVLNYQPTLFRDGDVPDLLESERLLKHLDTQKRDKEIKILAIKESKMQGEVVPTSEIQPAIYRLMNAWITSCKAADKDLLNQIAHKYDITPQDRAEYSGLFIKKRNFSIQKSAELALAEIESVVDKFAVKRGIGERDV